MREYVVLDPSGDFAPEPRLQAWLLGAGAEGGDAHRSVAPTGTLWCVLIPFGFRLVDGELRAVDRQNGEVFPAIRDVEPQLRREVQLRREAQERAHLAEERAAYAEEQERQSAQRERLALAEAQAARMEVRQALERTEREAAARRALKEELARLRER